MTAKPSIKLRRAAQANKRGIELVEQMKREEEKLFESLGPLRTKELLAKRAREYQETVRNQKERDELIVANMRRDKEITKSRQNLPAISQLEKVVQELLSLTGYTTSSLNPNSMSQKDQLAHRAVLLAGELIGPLIRWAINHETGKAIKNRKSLMPIAGRELTVGENARNLAANSHENEWLGSNYDGKSPTVNQRVAGKIFQLLAESMGFQAGRKVAGAIRSLEFGVVYDEVKPRKSGRKQTAIKKDNAYLLALKHVEFRNMRGMSYEDARFAVAEAFNLSSETLKKMKDEHAIRLATIDPAVFKRACEDARAVGALLSAVEDNSKQDLIPAAWRGLDIRDLTTATKIRQKAQAYSDERLKQDGHDYQLIDSRKI